VIDLPANQSRFREGASSDLDSEEKRLLVLVDDTDVSSNPDSSGTTAVNIVFNFFTELKKKAPVGRE